MTAKHASFHLSSIALGAVLLNGCAGLRLNLIQAAHRKPSNVAMFFTVETRDRQPVGGLDAASFRIYEDGQLVSLYESQQTIINPEVAAEHYTLLLIDMSGSVTESDQVPFIVDAAGQFTSTLSQYHKVAVAAFDGGADLRVIQPFASGAAAARGIGALSSLRPRDPSTNLHGAVVEGLNLLEEAVARGRTAVKFGTLVVFTDGTDRASRVSAGDMGRALDDHDFDVLAIGVGSEIDEKALGSVGHSGYALAQNSDSIVQAFQAVTERIVAFTKSHYLLSYCSPARAGTHQVTVEAVTAETTGKVSYQFDAAGFGPKCDPNATPPFDMSRKVRRSGPRGGGTRLKMQASASASVSTTPAADPTPATNPELGDQ